MNARILIVEDDVLQRRSIAAILGASGFVAVEVGGGQAALERLLADANQAPVNLVLLDLQMPDLDGLTVLKRLRAADLSLPILVLTADGSVSRAVEAMQAGATDFLIKPVGPERLEVSIRNALSMADLSTEVRRLARAGDNMLSFSDLIAVAPSTRAAVAVARRVSQSDIPVLIEGESGSGKEVFARAIHGSSSRAGGPFVAVNCGALPAQLIESILFGHEKGAFTGATARRLGRFQEASGGTLFLDEIGELPAEAQVKLLRALQMGEVDPIGSSEPVSVDIRLISATNRDLKRMIGAGSFREDLYYRLSVFPMTLPPLRERREDIPALARMFLRRFAAAEQVAITGFSQAAIETIAAAGWPGNVRQLENTIHRAVVMADGSQIRPQDLQNVDHPAPQPRGTPSAAPDDSCHGFVGPDGHIKRLPQIERELIQQALGLYGGRISETARRLGIGRSTLYRKLDDYQIGKGGG